MDKLVILYEGGIPSEIVTGMNLGIVVLDLLSKLSRDGNLGDPYVQMTDVNGDHVVVNLSKMLEIRLIKQKETTPNEDTGN